MTVPARQDTLTAVGHVPASSELSDVERDVLRLLLMASAEFLADRLRAQEATDAGSPLPALVAARGLGLVVEDIVRRLVAEARAGGHTWAAIGATLHVTRQAAFQRFGGSTDGSTMEMATGAVPDASARAVAILEHFLAGRWDAVRASFDQRMTERCPVGLLESVRVKLGCELGGFTTMGPPVVRVREGYTVVDVPLVHERGTRCGRVVFDVDAQVAGFFVLPPQGA